MPRLSNGQRHQAIGLLTAARWSQQDVAAHFGCHRNTVSNLLRRYESSDDVVDLPRSGRPRVTSRAQDKWIRQHHLRNRRQTAADTARSIPDHRRIHPQTVINRFREYDIRPRRPALRPILLPRHRQARLQWCRRHVRWNLLQWRTVLFTDESRFCLSQADGRHRVYRRRGERYANVCVVERNRFGGGSVMVWGGFTARHRTQLVIIQGNLDAAQYKDRIVGPVIIPFLRQHGPGLTLQQDNARPHSARIIQSYMRQHGIILLPWPATSPDLSLIEHVWDEMERQLRRQSRDPVNVRELATVLERIWNSIPQDFLARLVTSMRRRCTTVIDADGGHTRY